MTLLISFFCRLQYVVLFMLFMVASGCVHNKETVRDRTPVGRTVRVAVLPVENLSGRSAPFREIRQTLIGKLEALGVDVLTDEALERFIVRRRVRYAGGMDDALAAALRDEEGVDAALITSLELYDESQPPRIGLICRLVSTGPQPAIIWIESIGLSGDQSPGILGLGLIEDPAELRDKAAGLLVSSLAEYLSGEPKKPEPKKPEPKKPEEEKPEEEKPGDEAIDMPDGAAGDLLAGPIRGWPDSEAVGSRYRPKVSYRAPFLEPGRKYVVAAVPFFNRGDRKNAGEILLLHFVDELMDYGMFDVIEPGVVRQRLLNARVIMYEGISLSDADLVANTLNADLVLTGQVVEYQDFAGADSSPKVEFSVAVIERMSKKVIWASTSYNRGDDGVLFFDIGKKRTASTLAREMARAVAERLGGE